MERLLEGVGLLHDNLLPLWAEAVSANVGCVDVGRRVQQGHKASDVMASLMQVTGGHHQGKCELTAAGFGEVPPVGDQLTLVELVEWDR